MQGQGPQVVPVQQGVHLVSVAPISRSAVEILMLLPAHICRLPGWGTVKLNTQAGYIFNLANTPVKKRLILFLWQGNKLGLGPSNFSRVSWLIKGSEMLLPLSPGFS